MSKKVVEKITAADEVLNASGVGPFPLPIGRLAPVTAAVVSALTSKCWWAPSMREMSAVVMRGVELEQIQSRVDGYKEARIIGPQASAAGRALTAVGVAMAGEPVVVSLGIGSASDGAFYEALNLAVLQSLNVTFVVTVEPLTEGAPLTTQVAAAPSAIAEAFGVQSVVFTGVNMKKIKDAVKKAIDESGPSLIEVRL